MPHHHPSEALLMEHASGALGEASAVVVCSHLALCERCHGHVIELEQVGGELLTDAPGTALSASLLDHTLEQLDAVAPLDPPRPTTAPDVVVPAPLMEYLGMPLNDVPWRRISSSLSVHEVCSDATGNRVKLMRIRAGASMPGHAHGGRELTLVLSGGFSDESGHYVRGDLAEIDDETVHTPAADHDGDCICVAVNEGDVRLTGVLGRLLNPFVNL